MMTPFEKKFIGMCLDKLDEILSDKKQLDDALGAYTQGNSSHPRHELNHKIADASHWTPIELRHFNAAHSEAVFRVMSFHFCDEKIIHEINTALQLFTDQYIEKITFNTKKDDRISSVKKNIALIKKAEFNVKEELSVNPFSFFSPAVPVSLVATAAAATLLILIRGSMG